MTGRTAVVALALCAALAASPASRAATIVYDLAGTTSGLSISLAPQSGPTPGIFTHPVGPGSSLTLDFDANGDGVAGDVTIAASHIVLQGTDNLFAGSTPYGSLTFDAVAQLVGGHGQVVGCEFGVGGCIDWDSTATTYSTTGTEICFGAICNLLGANGEPEGVPLPYSVYAEFMKAIGYADVPNRLAPNLAGVERWGFTPDFGTRVSICGPDPYCEGGPQNRVTIAQTASYNAFWLDLEMQAVPEPMSLASVSLALLFVALGRSIRL